jgi:hypothetical protein
MSDERPNPGINDDGGCAVDWTWLAGERVASVKNGLDSLTITFESGLILTTRALLWRGKIFLAFDPYLRPTSNLPPPPR